MHVLVTGGAGFIGSHLVEYHLSKGDQVLAVDDLSTGTRDNLDPFFSNPNFRFEGADILTWRDINSSICWADRIYHMAAVVGLFKVLKEPIKVLLTNITGSERMLRSVHSCKWHPDILMASTSEVYGNRFHYGPNKGIPDIGTPHICPANLKPCPDIHNTEHGIELSEEMELVVNSNLNARTNYSVSKLADELFGLSYARQFNIKVRMIRFFNVIGPRQTGKYGMVVPRFVSQGVEGKSITVFGEGTQTRCFMDVRDAVVALDLLGNSTESIGEIINVGTNRRISISQLAEKVKEITGGRSEITYTPYKEAYGEGFDEIYHRRPSLKKLNHLIQFSPKWTLEKTIEDLVETKRAEVKNKETK
jgi:UDP-glucose 4-epimerase